MGMCITLAVVGAAFLYIRAAKRLEKDVLKINRVYNMPSGSQAQAPEEKRSVLDITR
jgi:hypothetical protein